MSDPVREALKESMNRNDMWSALEKPKWTSEPPKEPGWYWQRWKTEDGWSKPYPFETMGLNSEFSNIQWWPISIQVPEEEE